MKTKSTIVILLGSGFSTEKYKAMADKKVVVSMPILFPASS